MGKTLLFVILAVISALSTACSPPAPAPSANTSANANTRAPEPAKPELPPQVAKLPVTMPLVDAMLLDKAFADRIKGEIGLSDEEFGKVQDAARSAVLQLDGGDAMDSERSTRSAEEKAKADIAKVIGSDRTTRLFNAIRMEWAGEGSAPVDPTPNAVPKDTRIVVNAPAYRMDLFQDGKLVKSYKVGIGYPEFPLPVGVRRAREIIFNPTWTPPDEPWVKGKIKPGEKVEAGSKLNPLGPIKIPIGLPSLIHGGKDPSRLGTFASHGCVGLTNALVQDFAQRLSSLGGSSLNLDEIKAYEKTKTETKEFKLSREVAVELRYETILAEDGQITVFRDVYERGTNTEENLERVLEANGLTLSDLSEGERTKLMDALKQMAVDAQGEAVDPNQESANESNKKNSSAKVTRSLKGEKQIVVAVAALKGKGYPKAVDANT